MGGKPKISSPDFEAIVSFKLALVTSKWDHRYVFLQLEYRSAVLSVHWALGALGKKWALSLVARSLGARRVG